MIKALKAVLMLLGSAAILIASAATAFAGGGYAGGVAGESTGGGGTGGGGTLPFTGAELAVYLVIGLMILGSGLALRAYSARRTS
jgi:LPXTG cell wall anchor motif